MPQTSPFLPRFFYKVLHELLPAAIASFFGAVVFNYCTHISAGPPPTSIESVTNAEFTRIVRDEHSLIIDYLEKQNEDQQKSNRSADDDMLKSKSLQRSTLLNPNGAAPAKARALVHRDEVTFTKKTPPRRPSMPMTKHEPLQFDYAANTAPAIEAPDHPVPPASIPNVTSSFNSKLVMGRSISRFAGFERVQF